MSRRSSSTILGGIAASTVLGGWLGGPAAAVAVAAGLLAVPLFATLALSASVAWVTIDNPLNRLAPRVLDDQFAGSPVLVTIPLFTIIGYLLAESKAPERIVRAANAWLGWMPGGLAIVCLAASAFFTTLTGGSGVTIVAIGGLLLPTLRSQGYSERFSLGLVTTGGSLGLLFPPALPILVYALVAGLDLTLTFKAAFVPGLLVLGVLVAYAFVVGKRDKLPTQPFDGSAAVAALNDIRWELGIPVIILGSFATDFAGLDGSAAIAATYTAWFLVRKQRDVEWRALPGICMRAVALAGSIILILMMANAFMNFVVDRQLPTRVLDGLVELGLTERWQFLIALNIFLLVLGMIMDGVSALTIGVPLVLPFAAKFGLHPFHVAVMFLLNLELAFCMPPLGLNLFIASMRFEKPAAQIYRAVVPFVALLFVSLIVLMGAPAISTALVQPDIQALRSKSEKLNLPPREAWMLECVQTDALNPRPCSEEDRVRYAPPDAGTDDEDDALLKEMLK